MADQGGIDTKESIPVDGGNGQSDWVAGKNNAKNWTKDAQTKAYYPDTGGVDDGGSSTAFAQKNVNSLGMPHIEKGKVKSLDYIERLKRYYNIRPQREIDIFGGRYRFGVFDPYNAIGGAKEFLFFTRPDLHIYSIDDENGTVSPGVLNPDLESIPFFQELNSRYPDVIYCLQNSAVNGTATTTCSGGRKDPFNHLLGNMVTSNLSIPSLEAETIETASNMYGVNLSYRGSSENSNDNFTFDLEFRDTRYLHVYQFFRAYEEYETLKHHGTVRPYIKYITNKILHDQFSIYKFIVDEDYETILYYAKYWGVIPTSLPRDVFTSDTFEDGLGYTVSFKAAFFDDMNPQILNDFNYIGYELWNSCKYRVDIYNDIMDVTDNRRALCARVQSCTSTEQAKYAPGQKKYKLKWRGDENGVGTVYDEDD